MVDQDELVSYDAGEPFAGEMGGAVAGLGAEKSERVAKRGDKIVLSWDIDNGRKLSSFLHALSRCLWTKAVFLQSSPALSS